MSEAIVVALITGGLSLIGVVATCVATSKKSEKTELANMAFDRALEGAITAAKGRNTKARLGWSCASIPHPECPEAH